LGCSLLGGVTDRVDDRQVLLRRHREQLGHRRQPARQGELQPAPALRLDTAKDRLADAVVAEPHRLLRSGLHDQQAVLDGRRQVIRHVRRVGRDPQQAQLGPPAQAGHRLHRGPGLFRHGRETRLLHLRVLRPVQAGTHGLGLPAPPSGGRRQDAVAAQRVE
jgi:hypothetical protein